VSRIVITGLGVISAIGNDLAANHFALKEGKCGITDLEMFESRYAGLLPSAEIKITTDELKDKLQIRDPGATRTMLLALHAFEEAILDAGWEKSLLSAPDTAFIGACTVGGMCLTDELFSDAHKTSGGSAFLASYDCGSVGLFLQNQFSLTGVVNTINTACSSSANSIMYGARLIKNGFAKRCIVGGVDSLAKYTINGFNALHILSNEVCTPFDQDRNGLNLGEGAAFLVLEKEEDAMGNIYGELSGYFNANDSFHPSTLSETGDGPLLAMKGALRSARLSPEDIGYINAHGTGTENNDEVESKTMLQLFGEPPAFASTKSNTGHTLGAAGAIEAAFSLLNLYNQELYPSLHFNQPIASTGLVPVVKYQRKSLDHVMSNSFGFGGNCTSLIFSKA
jgi:3-oxoacyl-(acyl-carrier-protein) synthase